MSDGAPDNPGVIAPPPLIYAGALAVGLFAQGRGDSRIAPTLPRVLGWLLIFGGVLLLPAVLFVMQRGVIEREERYLERKFGDEYLRYKARVRRWI